MGKNKIPSGWVSCPKNANHLVVSKFMPLKTPLCARYNHQLPPTNLFHPEEIFAKAKRNGVSKVFNFKNCAKKWL